jgi:hypothetical protein
MSRHLALPHVAVQSHIHLNVRPVTSAEPLEYEVFTERTWETFLELGFSACYKAFKV